MHTFVHEPSHFILGNQIASAETFWARWRGLSFRKHLPPGTGLFLPNCSAIHTMGMRCVIDLIYLDDNLNITGFLAGAKPFRFFFAPRGSKHTLELPAGTLHPVNLKAGDRLRKL